MSGARRSPAAAPQERRLRLSSALACVIATGLAFDIGCASEPTKRPTAPAICKISTTVGQDKAAAVRTFPPQYWFVLLLKGYQASGQIARPARDCRGIPATLESDACTSDPTPADDDAPLAAADLHVTPLGDSRRLVWIEARHLSDGRSEGPVALVDLDAEGLAVRAIGTLRGYRGNVTLRLVTMQGGTVLAAESEQCRSETADGRDRSKCDRAIRVMPLVNERFVDKPLADAAGRCLDSTFLPVRRLGTASDGTRYQFEATVAFAPDTITIREELALSGGPGRVDPSFVTRVQSERKLSLRDGRLFASEQSLLARWLARQTVASPGR